LQHNRLNSLVNILLDNPMTQFSFEWILSPLILLASNCINATYILKM